MKLRSLFFCIALGLSIILSSTQAKADSSLDGVWTIHSKVVKGVNKGLSTEHTISITQDLSNGRIDGKTIGDDETQIGRVSGLVRGTIVEMTFSFKNEVLRGSMTLSADGRLMGGIFRGLDGGEGILYALKEDKTE